MSSGRAADPVDASDDLDDLDDILDEFNTTNKPAVAAATSKSKDDAALLSSSSSSVPAPTQVNAAAEENGQETEEESNERFARELAVGMEALMKDLGGQTGGAEERAAASSTTNTTVEAGNENLFNEQEMMKQFEQMMADMGLAGMGGMEGLGGSGASNGPSMTNPSSSSSANPAAPAPPANFQDAIKNTMSRLRESDVSASSSTGAAADGMDLEKLMAALGGAEGLEGEEGISKMLESMMGELMSREILYEPLNELKDKYPDYLANPPKALSSEDRARYEKQYSIVSQVITIFDDPKFERGTESEKAALKAQVQTLMNEMQDNGAPPAEIVGDLPPELEGMSGLGGDENCSVM